MGKPFFQGPSLYTYGVLPYSMICKLEHVHNNYRQIASTCSLAVHFSILIRPSETYHVIYTCKSFKITYGVKFIHLATAYMYIYVHDTKILVLHNITQSQYFSTLNIQTLAANIYNIYNIQNSFLNIFLSEALLNVLQTPLQQVQVGPQPSYIPSDSLNSLPGGPSPRTQVRNLTKEGLHLEKNIRNRSLFPVLTLKAFTTCSMIHIIVLWAPPKRPLF